MIIINYNGGSTPVQTILIKKEQNKMIDKLESLYTERAIIEKSVEQYGAWMESEGYAKLMQAERDIIDKQFSFMNSYLHCMNQRIELELIQRNSES